ncbi:unnamed protein product [Hapterophycus canaliculatus]
MSQCGHHSCSKRPTYGVAGSTKREFCSQHAKEGMINVNNKRCIQANCTTIPSFAVAGSKKAEFCSQHAREGMIDVRSKRCSQRGCSTQPSSQQAPAAGGGGSGNSSGKIPGSSCAQQQGNEGFGGLRSKRCGRHGCTLQATYVSSQGNERAEFCAQHANDGILPAGIISGFGEYGIGGHAAGGAAAGVKRKQPSPPSPYALAMAGFSAGATGSAAATASSSGGSSSGTKRAALPTAPVMQFQPQVQPHSGRYTSGSGDSLQFRHHPSQRYLAEGPQFPPQPHERYLGGGGSQFRAQSAERYHIGGAGLTPVGAAGESGGYSDEIATVFDKEMPL